MDLCCSRPRHRLSCAVPPARSFVITVTPNLPLVRTVRLRRPAAQLSR
jgi:hypothetical protein